MLEITRGRTWSVPHTIYDDDAGTLTDLTEFVEFRSQIREKVAVRNAKGIFAHRLVANVEVVVVVEDSQIFLKLSRAATAALQPGSYLIDLVAEDADGADEDLLEPEPVVVVNGPTSSFLDDAIPEEIPALVPDFSDEFNDALLD